MNRSTSVTIEATTRMNTGMRTSWVIWLRNIPTSMLDAAITAAVASPMPSALVAVPVMAMAGHRPSSMASTPLFSHRPSLTMVLYCAAILMSLLVHLCFGGVHVHHLLLVGENAHAEYFPLCVDAQHELHLAGIADAEYLIGQAGYLAFLGSAIDGDFLVALVFHGDGILNQIVVVYAVGNHLSERIQPVFHGSRGGIFHRNAVTCGGG